MENNFLNECFNNFSLINVCGKGAHGTIYKIRDNNTCNIYALKEVRINKKDDKRNLEDTSKFIHQNIRSYRYISSSTRPAFLNKKRKKTPSYAYILSDFHQMTLRDFLKIRNDVIFGLEDTNTEVPKIILDSIDFSTIKPTINAKYINKILRGIAFGIRYLHREKTIHRDIKPENIFFLNEFDPTPKIGDFGDLKIYNGFEETSDEIPMTSNVGTEAYSAPEMLTCWYSKNVDVYSLGLVYFELLNPFETEMERIIMFEELKSTGKVPKYFKNKYINESSIIESCIAQNPSNRFSSRKLISNLSFDE